MSMIASLELLHNLAEHGPVLALLGDMLELGPLERDSHKEVLLKAKELGLQVGCAGPRFSAAAQELGLTLWKTTENSSEMAAHVAEMACCFRSPSKCEHLAQRLQGAAHGENRGRNPRALFCGGKRMHSVILGLGKAAKLLRL